MKTKNMLILGAVTCLALTGLRYLQILNVQSNEREEEQKILRMWEKSDQSTIAILYGKAVIIYGDRNKDIPENRKETGFLEEFDIYTNFTLEKGPTLKDGQRIVYRVGEWSEESGSLYDVFLQSRPMKNGLPFDSPAGNPETKIGSLSRRCLEDYIYSEEQ